MAIKKLLGLLDWFGRGQTVYAALKVYVLPTVLPVLAGILGYVQGESWMWIITAASLVFAAAATGVLRVSEYRERKNPANKVVYTGTNFHSELVPAPLPLHGNREYRRAQRGQQTHMLTASQIAFGVNHKLDSGQISVTLKNNASFPMSCILHNAETQIEEMTPPRTTYPKPPKLMGPGESLQFSDASIDLDGQSCGTLTGEMDFTIRYGLPGDERHELRLRGNLQINMEPFGFVSSVHTNWLASLQSPQGSKRDR